MRGGVVAGRPLTGAIQNLGVDVERAFVRLRHLLASHHQLAAKLDELEHKIATHDTHIVALFDAVRSLMAT